MKQDFDRIKNDVETLQKAMGMAPTAGREWVGWMRKDNWLNLWWALPGAFLIASSWVPTGRGDGFFGLAFAQWTGLLTAVLIVALAVASLRKATAQDGRPPGLIREYKRFWGLDAHGKWVTLALTMASLLYFCWALFFKIKLQAFWSGLFILGGAAYVVVAVLSQVWLLLGVALPMLVYGLFEALLGGGKISGIPLGLMFVGIGLSCYSLQAWQIRRLESQDESH